MDLIDRYLHAVRRDLPKDKAEDIVAELRDDLMSRQEAREDALGRPLGKDETSALLKEFGHPLVVASRYRKHQYLIGPETYPFYAATMRIVALIVAAVVLALAIAKGLAGSVDPIQAVAQAMSGLAMSVLANLAVVTLIFALLERNGFPADHIAKWVPDQLPEVLDKQPGPWESAIEVALGIAFLLWWTGVIRIPFATGSSEFRITPDPVFAAWYWPILVLVAARLVHSLVQWLRPRWKTVRGLLNAATAAGGVVMLALLYKAGHWVTVTPLAMAAEQAAKLDESINLSLRIAIMVVAVIWTLGFLGALYRIAKDRFDRA